MTMASIVESTRPTWKDETDIEKTRTEFKKIVEDAAEIIKTTDDSKLNEVIHSLNRVIKIMPDLNKTAIEKRRAALEMRRTAIFVGTFALGLFGLLGAFGATVPIIVNSEFAEITSNNCTIYPAWVNNVSASTSGLSGVLQGFSLFGLIIFGILLQSNQKQLDDLNNENNNLRIEAEKLKELAKQLHILVSEKTQKKKKKSLEECFFYYLQLPPSLKKLIPRIDFVPSILSKYFGKEDKLSTQLNKFRDTVISKKMRHSISESLTSLNKQMKDLGSDIGKKILAKFKKIKDIPHDTEVKAKIIIANLFNLQKYQTNEPEDEDDDDSTIIDIGKPDEIEKTTTLTETQDTKNGVEIKVVEDDK